MFAAIDVIVREDVFLKAPFSECHAATIEAVPTGLLCAWFAGSREGAADVGIWLSAQRKGKWSAPLRVAGGDGYPCWNPVLFRAKSGVVLLFYKVGPDPRHWWGMLKRSTDNGKSWSKPQRLPEGILGPIKNRPIQIDDETILCPSSTELPTWRIHFETTTDEGKTWTKTDPLNDGTTIQAIQPSIFSLGNGGYRAIGRTQQDRIFTIDSGNWGKDWEALKLGSLPNSNSGLDAIRLKDERFLIVFNNIERAPGQWSGRRSPLTVAISDDADNWKVLFDLEHEEGQEFSYPTVIQDESDKVHIVYTWKRKRIRHVVLDPDLLKSTPSQAEVVQ